jgi:hypothetical protein
MTEHAVLIFGILLYVMSLANMAVARFWLKRSLALQKDALVDLHQTEHLLKGAVANKHLSDTI